MREALQKCCAGKQPRDLVFTREGKPIGDFRKTWAKVLRAAGITRNFRLQNLHNTGVRNLVRSGVSEHVAMSVSGHLTRAVFDRYDITSTKDLAEAAHKLDARRRAP